MWFCEIYLRDVCLARAAANISGLNIGGTNVLETIDWGRTHPVLKDLDSKGRDRNNERATDNSERAREDV